MRQKQAKDGNESKMELEEFEPSENVLKASKTLKTTHAAPIGIIGQQVLASKVGCSCTCYECMNVNIAVRARHGGSKTEMLSGYCSVK